MDLRVIKAEDTGLVWISFESINRLEDVEISAAKFASSKNVLDQGKEPWRKDETCVIHWKDRWRRGRVSRLFSSAKWGIVAEVFLTDYGTNVTAPISELIAADATPLSLELPLIKPYYLAPKAAMPTVPDLLAGVPWSDAIINLIKLVGGISDEWGILMQGHIREDDSLDLYHVTAKGDKVSINNMLLNSGLLTIEQEDQLIELPDSVIDSVTETPTDSLSDPLNSGASKYSEKLKQYLPSQPVYVPGVYIEDTTEHVEWCTLEETPFDKFVCSSLKEKGFKFPTPVQSNGWYHIWSCTDTVLVSPTRSGKTLGYLLPLLCLSAKREREFENVESACDNEPEIVVLVNNSYKSWNVNNQATTIFSWLNAAKRFRCCALYPTSESDSLIQILNGVDIVVATPGSLWKLIKRGLFFFKRLKHLVLDDVVALLDTHRTELNDVMRFYKKKHPSGTHVVACSSCYSTHHWSMLKLYMTSPVTVVTDVLELLVMKEIKTVGCFCSSAQVLKQNLLSFVKKFQQTKVVICVSSDTEATSISQLINLHCFKVSHWLEGLPTTNISILSDANLSKILDTNKYIITCLLHYTLPDSKALFKKRLSLLLPAIYSNQSVSQLVLLTSTCQKQSSDILSLIVRLGDTPPPELASMVTKQKEEQMRRHPFRDLCLELKSFGICSNKDCSQLHSVRELDKIKPSGLSPAMVPKNGLVKVHIESVSSPCQLWVKILDHTPICRGETPTVHSDTYSSSQLSMDLALYYNNSTNRILQMRPSIGDICCLLHDNGSYYRVKILEFSQPLGLFFSHKEQARVRLIDSGSEIIVDVNQLYTLAPSFLATPPLVIEAFLCSMLPLGKDREWSPLAIETAQNILEGHTLTGCVTLSLNETIWLDPVEERLNLSKVGVSTAVERPQKVFLDSEVTINNFDHLYNLKCSLNLDTSEFKTFKFEDCSTVAPPSGSVLQVKVTAVESPCHFYVQLENVDNELTEITDRLNTNLAPPSLVHSMCQWSLSVGAVCAAKFPFDDRWYRVVIMDERQSEKDAGFEYLCFFADYGDLEWVELRYVQPICLQLLELPFQAMCCSLSNCDIKDFNNQENAQKKLWNITRDQSLTMHVLDTVPDFCVAPFPPAVCSHVELMAENDNDILSLLLIGEGTDDDSLPLEADKPSEFPEFDLMLNLLLSEESDEIVSEFMPFVLANHGKIDIEENHCDDLVLYFEENYEKAHSDVLKGLFLIACTNQYSGTTLANHKKFCDILLSILKDTSNTNNQILILQLLLYLLVSKNGINCSYDNLYYILCNMALNSSGQLLSLIMECTACLVAIDNKYLPTLEMLEMVCDNLDNSLHHHSFMRLICSLLHSEIGCKLIAPHLPDILSHFKHFSPEIKEQLLISLLISTFHWPQLIHSHILHYKYLKQLLSNSNELEMYYDTLTSLGVHENLEQQSTPLAKNARENQSSDSGCNCSDASNQSLNYLHKKECLTPQVLWSQTHQEICLSVQVKSCDHYNLNIEDNVIVFWCAGEDKKYQFLLELFGEIEKSNVTVSPREVVLKLSKVLYAFWPRLTNSKSRPNFVGIDHDRWKQDSSDEEHVSSTKIFTSPAAIYDGDNTSNEDCYESDQSSNEKDVVMSDVVDMFS